jgi:hypothetical protein
MTLPNIYSTNRPLIYLTKRSCTANHATQTMPREQLINFATTLSTSAETTPRIKPARSARSKVSSRSTRPSRPTSFRAHNHQLKRATGVRATSSNAGRRARMLTLVPAGAYRRTVGVVGCPGCIPTPAVMARPSAPLRSPGRLLWLSDVTLGGPLAACARDGGPTSSEAGSAVGPARLSNAPRARRPAPQSMPLRGELLDAPLTRPRRLRGATEARCVGAHCSPPASLSGPDFIFAPLPATGRRICERLGYPCETWLGP